MLRRVTTTTFLHSGLCTSRCRMCPPTLPVAPSNIAVYSTLGISVRSRVASGADIPVLDERIGPDVRDQLFLGDPVARAVDQELENRECARTDLNRPVSAPLSPLPVRREDVILVRHSRVAREPAIDRTRLVGNERVGCTV